MAATPGFGKLPVEVVEEVIGYLALEEPASTKELRQEPSIHLFESGSKPLKNLSLTCASLRNMVFPFLFQFLRLGFDSLTPQTARGDNADTCLQGLYKLSRFVSQNGLAGSIRGLTFFFPVETELGLHYLNNFRHKLVSFALGEVNPQSLTLIASPAVLGEITEATVYDRETWAFGQRVHVLNFRQPFETSGPGMMTRYISSRIPSALYDIRPWNRFTLNEGSSLRAYSTYDYHLKDTPSIIQYSVPSSGFTLLPNVQQFEYVAIFPLARHIIELASMLSNMPGLVSLFTQFTPAADARRNVLEDAHEAGKANISDVWLEATQSYRSLAEEILSWGQDSLLRRWTASDHQVPVDDIVGAVLLSHQALGWKMTGPQTWERVYADVFIDHAS
ncbi:MAG: hypothetical protein L6R39_004370 [Caloplaca ligustica]|nr:MAG: hypothetical protein L6R39_004370 [Caloplaca ligustica]